MPTNVTNERQTETHTAVKLVLAYIAGSMLALLISQRVINERYTIMPK